MLKLLKSLDLGSLFGAGGNRAPTEASPAPFPVGGIPAGTLPGMGPAVDPMNAAAPFAHYAEDGAGGGAPAPRFSPEMQTVYMRLLESGLDPAEARRTLTGMSAQAAALPEPESLVRGVRRYAPGYGPMARIR